MVVWWGDKLEDFLPGLSHEAWERVHACGRDVLAAEFAFRGETQSRVIWVSLVKCATFFYFTLIYSDNYIDLGYENSKRMERKLYVFVDDILKKLVNRNKEENKY